MFGEDEQFELCKDTFLEEATIECIENRLPGTIDVTILAIPCDGILECRDGSDENCEEDKLILVIVTAVLFMTTICIYMYLVFVRLPIWKNSVFREFDDGSIDSESWPSNCSGLKGNFLAKLKVFIAKYYILKLGFGPILIFFQNDTSQKQCAKALAVDGFVSKIREVNMYKENILKSI